MGSGIFEKKDCKGKFLFLEDLSNQEINQKTGTLSPGWVVGDTDRSLLCVFKLRVIPMFESGLAAHGAFILLT